MMRKDEMQEVFTITEARALQGKYLVASKDLMNDHQQLLVPVNHSVQVIGLDGDAIGAYGIAVQYAGHTGFYPPRVVLMNKTTYEEHFMLA
jgi:hypothetical protein